MLRLHVLRHPLGCWVWRITVRIHRHPRIVLFMETISEAGKMRIVGTYVVTPWLYRNGTTRRDGLRLSGMRRWP